MNRKVLLALFVLLITVVPSMAQQIGVGSQSPQSWLHGTYKFQMVNLRDVSVATNMFGQQVGFCNGQYIVGYGCWDFYTYSLLMGTFLADGRGSITGTLTETRDVNSYKCSPKNNPTSPCPVMVPSGNAYDVNKQYGVGAVVDYTPNSPGAGTKTFQAVKNHLGKPPDWMNSNTAGNICNQGNLNSCYWTQIQGSLNNTDPPTQAISFNATYTIQPDGGGVMSMYISACPECGMIKVSFVTSSPSEVGQVVSMAGMSQLGDSNASVGTAIRTR